MCFHDRAWALSPEIQCRRHELLCSWPSCSKPLRHPRSSLRLVSSCYSKASQVLWRLAQRQLRCDSGFLWARSGFRFGAGRISSCGGSILACTALGHCPSSFVNCVKSVMQRVWLLIVIAVLEIDFHNALRPVKRLLCEGAL